MGRAGKKYYFIRSCIDPKTRGCAVSVFKNFCSIDDIGLLFVDLGHRESTALKPFLNFLEKFFVENELSFEDCGERLSGSIIFCRTKPTHGYDDICVGKGLFDREGKIIPVISNYCFISNFHPQVIQTLCKEEGIGVLKVRGEKF